MIKEFPLKNPLLNQNEFNEMYQESFQDKELFWSKIAKEHISWSKDFTKVKNTNFYDDVSIKWFEDGELNVCYNAVDRHAEKIQIILLSFGKGMTQTNLKLILTYNFKKK